MSYGVQERLDAFQKRGAAFDAALEDLLLSFMRDRNVSPPPAIDRLEPAAGGEGALGRHDVPPTTPCGTSGRSAVDAATAPQREKAPVRKAPIGQRPTASAATTNVHGKSRSPAASRRTSIATTAASSDGSKAATVRSTSVRSRASSVASSNAGSERRMDCEKRTKEEEADGSSHRTTISEVTRSNSSANDEAHHPAAAPASTRTPTANKGQKVVTFPSHSGDPVITTTTTTTTASSNLPNQQQNQMNDKRQQQRDEPSRADQRQAAVTHAIFLQQKLLEVATTTTTTQDVPHSPTREGLVVEADHQPSSPSKSVVAAVDATVTTHPHREDETGATSRSENDALGPTKPSSPSSSPGDISQPDSSTTRQLASAPAAPPPPPPKPKMLPPPPPPPKAPPAAALPSSVDPSSSPALDHPIANAVEATATATSDSASAPPKAKDKSLIEAEWHEAAAAALADGTWRQAQDKHGRTYFVNKAERVTVWNLAKELRRRALA